MEGNGVLTTYRTPPLLVGVLGFWYWDQRLGHATGSCIKGFKDYRGMQEFSGAVLRG